MADKKVIAVLGATGAQGGGMVRAIMADKSGEFTARALTRNVNSDKAKALKELGAEVVAVDVDNFDSLKNAFTGAYGVFAVTFLWEHFSAEKETAEAKSIAKAAKEANIQHIIWSTLEDLAPAGRAAPGHDRVHEDHQASCSHDRLSEMNREFSLHRCAAHSSSLRLIS